MSLQLILWLASVAGAALFFVGGLVLGRSHRRADETTISVEPTVRADATAPAPSSPIEDTTTAKVRATPPLNTALAAAEAETEHLRGELARTRADNDRIEKELSRLLQVQKEQNEALASTRENVRTATSERSRLNAECSRLGSECARLGEACTRLESELQKLQTVDDDLKSARARLRELEQSLEELRLDRTRAQERIRQLEREVSALDPEREKTLEHDLMVVREQLRAAEEKAQRVDEANTRLQREVEAAEGRVGRLELLEKENQQLRVRALASDLSPRTRSLGVERATSNIASTHALQSLVGQVADIDSVRAAVIGDDLGLVVASQGTHGEELAAIGALLGRACGDARKILPLDRIHRVILEDEGNISVTVRSLRSYDRSLADDELTLVTLAYGAEPDPGQVARILGETGAPPGLESGRDVREAQHLGT
ncbi:MAG TPA: hypothetical protein VGF45_00140 [Polyangia bacterium]